MNVEMGEGLEAIRSTLPSSVTTLPEHVGTSLESSSVEHMLA